MKKFLTLFFLFFVCFLFNTVNVHASENNNSELSEDEKIFWEKVESGLFYSPIQNNFSYSSGSTLSFSGGHSMMVYKSNILDNYFVYTLGNQIYQNYNTSVNSYPIDGYTYFFDDNNKLYRNTGTFELPYGFSSFGNIILSDSYISHVEAKDFVYSYQSLLKDESFLESNNLINKFQLDTWDETGHFNPFVDCRLTKDTATHITISDDGVFDIPLGVSGIYFDYLYADESYQHFSWWRCYINGVHGAYTLDDLEKELGHYRTGWDAICIIGIGTYNVDENVSKGYITAPNLEGYNVVSWNYEIFKLDKYNTPSAFDNSNFLSNYKGCLSITASTSGSDIEDNKDHTKPEGGSGFNIEDYFKNTDFGFGYISSYITSIGTNITSFNTMVLTVLGWLPSPILNLLCVALMTFVSILFIKLILHLL